MRRSRAMPSPPTSSLDPQRSPHTHLCMYPTSSASLSAALPVWPTSSSSSCLSPAAYGTCTYPRFVALCYPPPTFSFPSFRISPCGSLHALCIPAPRRSFAKCLLFSLPDAPVFVWVCMCVPWIERCRMSIMFTCSIALSKHNKKQTASHDSPAPISSS